MVMEISEMVEEKFINKMVSNVAYTFRLRYTGIPGVEFGLWHNHQTDINNIPAARKYTS